MTMREIPRSEWREQLDTFSRQHEGWLVRVAIAEADGRVHTEVRDLPLQGVSADDPENIRVAVMTGDAPDDHVTHEVARPTGIEIERTDAGADRALRIRAEDGTTTTVEFRSPMRPEEVDGIP